MIDYSIIAPEIRKLVGFRNTSESDYSPSAAQEASDSGLMVNDLFPELLRPSIIESHLPTYVSNDSAFQAWLDTIRDSASREVISRVNSRNDVSSQSRMLLSDSVMSTPITQPETSERAGRFVGYAVGQPGGQGKPASLRLSLKKVGMRVSQAQSLTFYVFHSSSNTPIATKDVTFSLADENNFVYKDLSLSVDTLSGNYPAGGMFLVGYFEDDLSANASKNLEISRKFFGRSLLYTQAVEVSPENLNGNLRPDFGQYLTQLNGNSYSYFDIQFSAYANPNPYYLDNIEVFAEAYQYMYALKLLETIRNSERVNFNADNLAMRDAVNYAIEGGKTTSGNNASFTETMTDGLRKRSASVISQVQLDFRGLDSLVFAQKETFKIETR